ncbi:MAG: hypothetical protein RLZZ371_1175 [Pseudomonadota bacterium]
MDKAPLTHINAGMGSHITLGKKDQITRADVVAGDGLTPKLHLFNGTRWHNPGPGLVNMGYQAAAIKARVGRVATVAVWRANQTNGIERHIAGKRWRKPRRNFCGVAECGRALCHSRPARGGEANTAEKNVAF